MESFQQQALCFSMPAEDFDPNRIPQDGEQYLQSVVYERNKCPAVVKKTLKKKFTAKHTQATDTKNNRLIWEQYNKVSFFLFLLRKTLSRIISFSAYGKNVSKRLLLLNTHTCEYCKQLFFFVNLSIGICIQT